MPASNAGPGGVKNLRAMFENKASDQSNSPPSRGRSPRGSNASLHDRPLSKVRANFVSVEREAEDTIQTQKQTKDPESCQEEADHLFNTSPHQSNPSSRVDVAHSKASMGDCGLGEILKGSPFVSDDESQENETKSVPISNGTADRAATMVKRMQDHDVSSVPTGEFIDPDDKPLMKPIGPGRQKQQPLKAHGASSISTQEGATEKPIESKPMPRPRGGGPKIQGIIDSARKAREAGSETTQAPAELNSSMPKPRGGGLKIQGVTESARKAREAGDEAIQPLGESSTPMPKSRGGAAKVQGVLESAMKAREDNTVSASGTARKDNDPEPQTHVNQSSAAFEIFTACMQPKFTDNTTHLQTQPSLTDNTQQGSPLEQPGSASVEPTSATKSLVRARSAGSSLPSKKVPSSIAGQPESSRATTSKSGAGSNTAPMTAAKKGNPRFASATTTSSLAKKASRASLTSTEHAARSSITNSGSSRVTPRTADEGFLARMMRPTASSAQKAHEKVQSAPVKPHQQRLANAAGTLSRPLSKRASRKSLSQTGENKENEVGQNQDQRRPSSPPPPLPVMPQEVRNDTTLQKPTAG